jgi:hypothetical protein
MTISTNPSPVAEAEATGGTTTTESTRQAGPTTKRSSRSPRRIKTAANGTVAAPEKLAASNPTVESEVSVTEPTATAPTPVAAEAPQAASVPRRRPRTGVMREAGAPQAVSRTAKPKRLQFQVTFTAEETLTARTVLELLQQAEARGATDIKSITRLS